MENKIEIYLIVFFASFLLFFAGVITLFLQYRNRHKAIQKEKKLRQQLHAQEMLSAKMEIQQQTMQFIGREIHDNVGQKLTLASLYSKQLSGTVNHESDKIKTIGNIIDESLADLRQLSRSLSDPSLANATLTEMLKQEAARINKLGSCHISVSDNSGNTILQPAQKNILFRIMQEFIQNSLKYSGCRKIIIELARAENSFEVIASDDGKGFDSSITYNGQGLGNMQRRAEELKAVYALASKRGEGTRLNIKMQYHEI